jgi:hypothetical protein
MTGLYNIMDQAMADALGTDVDTYIDVIENKCTYEEADFIITAVWNEMEEDIEKAKELFENCKQK